MANKIKNFLIILSCLLGLGLFSFSASASATVVGGGGSAASSSSTTSTATTDACHPDTTTGAVALSKAQETSCTNCDNNSDLNNCLANNVIVKDLQIFVNFLSAAAALVIIGSLIVGGIQYSLAGDSSDAVGKAKKRLTAAALALGVFLFIFPLVQWLIPGGIFK